MRKKHTSVSIPINNIMGHQDKLSLPSFRKYQTNRVYNNFRASYLNFIFFCVFIVLKLRQKRVVQNIDIEADIDVWKNQID